MLLASLALAVLPQAETTDQRVFTYEDHQLSFDLTGFETLYSYEVDPAAGTLGSWAALVDEETWIRFWIWTYDNEDMGFDLPEDLVGMREDIEDSNREGLEQRTGTSSEGWKFDVRRQLKGAYGYVPYGLLVEETDYLPAEKGNQPYLGLVGTLRERSYFVGASSSDPLSEERLAQLRTLLESGVKFAGEPYEKEWKEEEIEERWRRDVHEKIADDLKFIRTKHFLILTNSSGGKSFEKELEKAYKAIRKVYPFEEREELRLLPIFLFRTAEQYYDYCVKAIGWTRDEAEDSKGVAFGDVYATWYESPRDPVHIHELTHQLFGNRLFLNGGGSWFQEGVAEYMSTKPNDRKALKRIVKDGKHAPFKEFFVRRSLLGSSGPQRLDGTDPTGEAYLQAACITEFVRESKKTKKKFQEYIHRMGSVPRGDMKQIEGVLRDLFAVDVEGFEELFVEYWTKR